MRRPIRPRRFRSRPGNTGQMCLPTLLWSAQHRGRLRIDLSTGRQNLMARRRTLMTALTAALLFSMAACGSDDGGGSSGGSGSSGGGGDAAGKIGVILPDTTSSPRWEASDRPQLEAAFKAAGVDSDIQNA